MASLVNRLVVCLVAVVAVLQLVHLVLLNQLEERRIEELHHLHTQSAAGVDKEPSRRLDSINNGPQPQALSLPRLPHRPNDLPHPNNLNTGNTGDGLIEDIGGEFRILFDVVGPRSESPTVSHKREDDFVIDEENVIDNRGDGELDVTLVTSSDLRKMRLHLVPLIERWEGPLSLTLWVQNRSEVEIGLGFIAQARHCHALTKRFISFHIVFPLTDESLRNKTIPISELLLKEKTIDFDKTEKMCQSFFQGLGKVYEENGDFGSANDEDALGLGDAKGTSVYPINLLRNVGRKRISTRFSLVNDIDLIPSSGLRIKFQRFAKVKAEFLSGSGDERKTVFVVPAFERKKETEGEMPETKSQLLKLIDKYKARPFYFDLCWKCQVHTDYEAWQMEPSREQLSVLFEVLWKDPWEPFFISDNSIPLFDERFRQYGFNRLSQLCELHMGGYKFAVLNDAFLVHKGYETPNAFHAGKSKDLELNRAHFRQFKNEMRSKYPHSTRRCY